MKTILLLEDNEERIAGFRRAVAALGDGYELKVWLDAPSMLADCESFFPTAALISLDHDLSPQPGATADPGAGMDVAAFLAEYRPVCPVLIHSSNTDRSWSMHNELRFAKWVVDRMNPIGVDWIRALWLPRARELLSKHPNTFLPGLPEDHETRINRARTSLEGLSVGDGFGECFFGTPDAVAWRVEQRQPPPPPWTVTDDTMMAMSIYRCLKRDGCIDQDALASAFAREYARDPRRGYGGMAHVILRAMCEGKSWKTVARSAFGGQGSCGNGGAMRAAPIGAYFHDDYERVMLQAKLSAEITHAHPDGQTGGIAVALAAAWVAGKKTATKEPAHGLIEFVFERLPQTETRVRLKKALNVPFNVSPQEAAAILGNGSRVIASDTVPFCLWCAARHWKDFEEALFSTASVLGDCDTNCAIVGGIVACSTGLEGIPAYWLKAREPIQF